MSMAEALSAFFTDEWERFRKGVAQLDPETWRAGQLAAGYKTPSPTDTKTISIPGWDDVIKLGSTYTPTPAERSEYYAARRAHRAPDISPTARAAMDKSIATRDRIRTSAQPEYLQGWGSILTALDNVQDFASTLSTAGRLALWGAGFWGPFSQALALEGQLAALAGEATSAVTARRAAIYAGQRLLPLAARLGARLVPGLGLIILASDLLNLLGLIGTIATPLYALLCRGPAEALAAGVPTALFKNGLKRELWNAARRNPFGRQAWLAARSKAIGRLPTFGNVLEVAQTTEAFFGWGVSLGGIVGLLSEAAHAPLVVAKGGSVSVNAPSGPWYKSLSSFFDVNQPPAQLQLQNQAARVLGSAPLIMQHQTHFTDEEHLLTLVAVYAALGVLAPVLRPLDVDQLVADAMDYPMPPPLSYHDPATLEGLAADQLELPSDPRWPVPGSPRTLTGAEYVETFAPRIAAATRAFLEPRRTTPAATFAGVLVNMSSDAAWVMLTKNPDALHWELTTDWKLVTGLAERGYLLNVGDGADKLWPAWLEARALIDSGARRTLELQDWHQLAAKYGLRLIKQLPPDARWPDEWRAVAGPYDGPPFL